MMVVITKIGQKKLSQHGGIYQRVFFRSFTDEKSYFLDVYDSLPACRKWLPYIKEQALFDNVRLIPGKKYIDGYSQFTYKGQRHEIK